jgi:hypothetical protein
MDAIGRTGASDETDAINRTDVCNNMYANIGI